MRPLATVAIRGSTLATLVVGVARGVQPAAVDADRESAGTVFFTDLTHRAIGILEALDTFAVLAPGRVAGGKARVVFGAIVWSDRARAARKTSERIEVAGMSLVAGVVTNALDAFVGLCIALTALAVAVVEALDA